MRLTADVALVGGGTFTGFGLSADFDAHVYLLDGGDEAALVDCGMGTRARDSSACCERIAAVGCDPAGRRAAAADPLPHRSRRGRRGVPRARSAARVDRRRRAGRAGGPDHEATQFGPAQRAGIFPADYDVPRVPGRRPAGRRRRARGRPADRALRRHPGALRRPRLVPRHRRRAHVPARRRRGLPRRQAVPAGHPDCDLGVAGQRAAPRRVEFDALLPGHGAIALHDGGDATSRRGWRRSTASACRRTSSEWSWSSRQDGAGHRRRRRGIGLGDRAAGSWPRARDVAICAREAAAWQRRATRCAPRAAAAHGAALDVTRRAPPRVWSRSRGGIRPAWTASWRTRAARSARRAFAATARRRTGRATLALERRAPRAALVRAARPALAGEGWRRGAGRRRSPPPAEPVAAVRRGQGGAGVGHALAGRRARARRASA